MSDFFGTLETELRAAAERPARRTVPVAAIAVAVLLALALAPIVLVLGSGSDENAPERGAADHAAPADARPASTTVVATGVAPVAGRWQLETFVEDGNRCLGLYLVETDNWFSTMCPPPGGQPLPAFSARARPVPPTGDPEQHLVYGWTPAEAAAVEFTEDGALVERVETSEGPDDVDGDFFLMALPPNLRVDGRVRWVAEDGTVSRDELRYIVP